MLFLGLLDLLLSLVLILLSKKAEDTVSLSGLGSLLLGRLLLSLLGSLCLLVGRRAG